MARSTIQINSILDGWSQTKYLGSKNSFDSSIGVDPDLSLTTSDTKTSGVIVPVAYEDFSDTDLSGAVRWLITNPKDTNLYTYNSDGEVLSYSSSLTQASEAVIGTPTSGAGNGGTYYNNYIYFMTPTDISRYGPMDNSPSLTNTVWTGTTLGSQKSLVNTTYPSLRGLPIPNHSGHVHGDDSLYFCDFVNGKGIIQKIKTSPTLDYDAQSVNYTVGLVVTGGTSGATGTIVSDSDSGSTGTLVLSGITGVFQNNETLTDSGSGSATVNGTITEGAGNNGTTYNSLDLPFGFMPVDIESWGTDVVIVAIQTSDSTINQGKAALFFWDPTDTVSFYRGPVYLPDPLATALLSVNGILRIFSGNAVSGTRVSKYIGGETISDRALDTEFIEDSLPPFAGAVDAFGGRGVWGGFTTYPETSACVWALGSKDGKIPMGLHNIVRTNSASSTNQNATAVKYVQQADNKNPRVVVGWNDGA